MQRGKYIRTAEQNANNSKALMGHKVSAKQIEKMRKSRWTPDKRKAQSDRMMGKTKGRKSTFFGHKHTQEARDKIKKANNGKKFTAEHKAKIGKAHIGHKHTPEALAKMSKAHIGNKNLLGYKHTDEALEKMSKAVKERWENPNSIFNNPEYKVLMSKSLTKRGTQQICTNCGKLKDYFFNGYCEDCINELNITYPPRSQYKNIQLFDNPFPDSINIEKHHIHDWFIVPMPYELHKKCYYPDKVEHRERANTWLYYLFGIDFDLLIKGDI